MTNRIRVTVAALALFSVSISLFGLGAMFGAHVADSAPLAVEAQGLIVTKAEADTVSGGILRDIHTALDRAVRFKYWLDAKVDADLTAMGYTSAEIANMRSAYADADQLATIYKGSGTLLVGKDFRTFMRRVWGLGGVH